MLGADARGAPDGDRPREALGHLAVRRLGRAGDWRVVAALRGRELPGRASPRPRQHDDADVHARPRGGARRGDAGDRHGRARLRARDRPGGAAAPQPHACRSARQPMVERRPAGVPAARRRALRLGGSRPGATAQEGRRLADRHGHGRGRLPRRVLHARAACAGPYPRRRQRGRADRHPGVRHRRADDGDAGRRGRARRRPGDDGRSRPATPTCPTARRRSARPVRPWSAPPCTPLVLRCGGSSSTWRSATRARLCTGSAQARWTSRPAA